MNKLENHIKRTKFDRPTLVLDIAEVESNYYDLKRGMPDAHIHYAVKANPHPRILKRLTEIGCRFDAASMAEIQMCLDAGASPSDISFGNTIKRPQDIAWSVEQGIELFSADAEEELEKIAQHAQARKFSYAC